MEGQSSRHQAVLEELIEWREDIGEGVIDSRVVLLKVPPGWGATTVLGEFAASAADPDGSVTISVGLNEVLLAGQAADAKALSDALVAPLGRSRPSELLKLLGLGTAAGKIGLALGVGGLFVSGMGVQLSLLLAPYAINAAQFAWDVGPAGQQGVLARAAQAVAAVSAEVPVVVIVDDADRFDLDLTTVMLENLVSRPDGQVLVVAAVHPGSPLAGALRDPGRYGLAGRVVRAEADSDMSAAARTSLARELRPALPDSAAERIGQRTSSFADVFTIVGEGRLADLTGTDGPAAVAVVDTVIDAAVIWSQPSAQVRILGWASGTLTVGQADRALAVLGEHADPANDPNVIRAGGLARLRDPASARIRAQAGLLSAADRHTLAAAVLSEAGRLTNDSDATLIDRTVARLAVHRIRADLDPSADLTRVQCLLIRGLEQLGDREAAYQIAASALAELPRDEQTTTQRADLLKAWLRLARTRPPQPDDSLIEEAIGLATSSGAVLDVEARVWAAVNLLLRHGPHEAALSLTNQLITDLGTYPGRDPAAGQWRLLLAFHAGQAGYPAAAQQLLAPVVNSGTADQHKAARVVLRALEGPRADSRLQIIILEAELQAVPKAADQDLLRLHHALARNYRQLGRYSRALQHGTAELSYRRRLLGPDHPDVLTTRADIAYWTGEDGNADGALRLFQQLLPDRVRVLGPHHHDVLTTQVNIAVWTGEQGDAGAAVRLLHELLPDLVRVLGTNHHDVLLSRASMAAWIAKDGDVGAALQLYRKLLPETARVLGSHHPALLTTRSNIAVWTAESGDARGALQLSRELLPEKIQVLGADHPDVLTTRSHIARWTGQQGDAKEALRLFRLLLPDQAQVLGTHHPDVLLTRADIAFWTGQSGNFADALQLSRELLPIRTRVLGRDHPEVLITRGTIAVWTGNHGDAEEALRLFRELQPDLMRVLGPDHPHVLTNRGYVAYWTGVNGDADSALRQLHELLTDRIRVLGIDHPDVLVTRSYIATCTEQRGNDGDALRLLRALLTDEVRVLGPVHPNVMGTRASIARLTAKSGSTAGNNSVDTADDTD
jgi:tetratricopeptide (TPR) repeat protein